MKIGDFEVGSLSEKERKLEALLRDFPHEDFDESPIPNDFENGIAFVILDGRDNGWIDEFIRICEANKGLTFTELEPLIYTEERFPPLEIVDDE